MPTTVPFSSSKERNGATPAELPDRDMTDGGFLEPELADADGLVGVGGDLSPERLVHAYRHGIFPFFDENSPVLWWSPDPRAIFELDGLHISRRLARTI